MFSFVRQTSFENELPGPTPTDFLLCPSGILEESTEVFSALSFQGSKNPTGERMQETTPVSHKFSGYHVRHLLSKPPISEWPPFAKATKTAVTGSSAAPAQTCRVRRAGAQQSSSPGTSEKPDSIWEDHPPGTPPPNSESSRRLIRFAKVAFLF